MRAAKREARELDRAQGRRASDIMRERRQKAKALKGRSQERRDQRAAATDVVSAIGYDLMNVSGVCEVEPGLFSETIAFEDISYQSSRDSDQMAVARVMSDLLNYFSPDTKVQFSVINTPLREDEVGSRTFFDVEAQQTEAAREDAEEMNRILNKKLKEGVSNIRRTRLLTVAVESADLDDAVRRFARINTDLSSFFEQMRCSWHVMEGEERLAVVSSVLRPGKRLDFSYERDISPLSPISTKDFVAPMSLDFRPNGESTLYRSDEAWCQVLVMRGYSSPLSDRVVKHLVDLPMPIDVSWYVTPIDKAQAVLDLKVKAALIDRQIVDQQKKAVKEGWDYSLLPSEVSSSKAETDDLLNRISGQAQNLFFFSGLIWTWADSLERLTEQVGQIIDNAKTMGVEVDMLPLRQREAMNSVLPLGLNLIPVERFMSTDEAVIFVPFATTELEDERGNYYGQNRTSNNLVMGNRGRLTSPVGFVSGKTGSGKGFFVKSEIESTILSKPTDQIIIVDRAGEYLGLTARHYGTNASFGPDSPVRLNPLGLVGVETLSPEAQLAFKTDAVLAQAGAAAEEAGRPLTDEERSIIQRCVENVYHEASQEGRSPILQDLYEELLRQEEPQARSIALRYERYVSGATSYFNGEDTIDFSSRIVDLNIRDVPSSMLVFALVTMCEAVRNQMYANSRAGIRTWLYIEEMESLFRYPTVLEYFRRLSNEGRKFGLYLTGITQSTESMINNEDVSAIVKNSDFVMLLKQSAEDRRYWTDVLGLSEREAACIDETTPTGYGLLVFGASRIPIKGDFPKDSPLYELFSTDPNEAAKRSPERRA